MKKFLTKVKDYFDINSEIKKRRKQREIVLNILKDLEQRAKDYQDSDPYLAGLNEGRAQMLRYVIEHIYK